MKSRPVAKPAGELLRVLIVDDEPLARRRLREMMAEDPEVEVVAECGNGKDAVAAIHRDEPDVVLLDIQMPELDGFGVVRTVGPDRMPAVIFVTASDAHAVRAFDVHAVDYVLKPVDQDRLFEAIRVAKDRVASTRSGESTDGGEQDIRARLAALVAEVSAAVAGGRGTSAPHPSQASADRIAIKGDGRVIFIRVADVDWVEAMDNYVRLHVGREAHVMRETMAHLEERLPSPIFLRIHRSTLVNVERIREIQPWFAGDYVLILVDGTKLTTGRRYRPAVKALLDRAL